MPLKTLFLAVIVLLIPRTAAAQMFVTALGGASALTGASVVAPSGAANYDPKVGAAANAAVGFHLNDWFSAQASYIWNRNRLIVSQLGSAGFSRAESLKFQHAASFDTLLYFRPRTSRLRPYLSAGPAVVVVLDQPKLGLRVAVGADIRLFRAWGLRYSFSEMMSANPFAAALQPVAHGKLMNFQNLFGVVKTF